MNFAEQYRKEQNFEWPENAPGYMPMELAGSEATESLKKAGYLPATNPGARTTQYSSLEDYGRGDTQRTFVPPGLRDEVFVATERLRQADATGGAPKTAETNRYRSDTGFERDNPQLKVIKTEHGERIEVIRI